MKVPRRALPTFYFYLLVLPSMFLIEQTLKHFGVMLNLTVWSILSGIAAAFSLAMFTYKAPVKMKMGKLSEAVSSIVLACVGIIIFVFMILATS